MALENIGSMMGQLGQVFVVSIMWLAIGGGFVGVTFLILKAMKYKQYKAIIFKRKKDMSGNETLVFAGIDKGAIIMDKKLKKRVFHLKSNNVHMGEEENITFDENRNLNVPSIPSEKGGEVVFIEKLGPKKFAFGESFIVSGKVEIIVTDADVAEAIRGFDINAKYYGGKEWTKWVGPISFAVFAILIVIMIAVVLQKFEVLSEVGDKLISAAEILKSSKSSAVASNVPG